MTQLENRPLRPEKHGTERPLQNHRCRQHLQRLPVLGAGRSSFYERRSAIIRMPLFGRSVTDGKYLTFWPGTSVSLHFCAIAASNNTASIIANPAPTHTLGPPPNGK